MNELSATPHALPALLSWHELNPSWREADDICIHSTTRNAAITTRILDQLLDGIVGEWIRGWVNRSYPAGKFVQIGLFRPPEHCAY
jgi:hypothetical protein